MPTYVAMPSPIASAAARFLLSFVLLRRLGDRTCLPQRAAQLVQTATGGVKIDRLVAPVEGLEPPTFGLQNRCSTS